MAINRVRIVSFIFIISMVLISFSPSFTNGQNLNSPIHLINSPLPSDLNAKKYWYFPITIYNNQSTWTPMSFNDIVIKLNEANYHNSTDGYYIHYNGSSANFYFVNAVNHTIPAWIQSNVTSSLYGILDIWLSVSFLHAYSNETVYLVISSNASDNFLTSGYSETHSGIGEYPNATSTYAQYDNGRYVFDLYSNFSGTSLPSFISATGGGSVKINNGVTINVPSGEYEFLYANNQVLNNGSNLETFGLGIYYTSSTSYIGTGATNTSLNVNYLSNTYAYYVDPLSFPSSDFYLSFGNSEIKNANLSSLYNFIMYNYSDIYLNTSKLSFSLNANLTHIYNQSTLWNQAESTKNTYVFVESLSNSHVQYFFETSGFINNTAPNIVQSTIGYQPSKSLTSYNYDFHLINLVNGTNWTVNFVYEKSSIARWINFSLTSFPNSVLTYGYTASTKNYQSVIGILNWTHNTTIDINFTNIQNQSYYIYFQETGILNNSLWTVNLDGNNLTNYSSIESEMIFHNKYTTNGTHSYIAYLKHYKIISGKFNLSGSNVLIYLNFVKQNYTVSFYQNNLTNGIKWYVDVNDLNQSSVSHYNNFTVPYGYVNFTSYVNATMSKESGNWLINKNTTIILNFSAIHNTYFIWLFLFDIPNGTIYYINIPQLNENLSAVEPKGIIFWNLSNGVYYIKTYVKGYTSIKTNITVNNANVVLNLYVSKIVYYSITVKIANGAITNGTIYYSVLYNLNANYSIGSELYNYSSSQPSSITFNNLSNGYYYLKVQISGYYLIGTTETISGQNITFTITKSILNAKEIYNVIFIENGLGNNDNWEIQVYSTSTSGSPIYIINVSVHNIFSDFSFSSAYGLLYWKANAYGYNSPFGMIQYGIANQTFYPNFIFIGTTQNNTVSNENTFNTSYTFGNYKITLGSILIIIWITITIVTMVFISIKSKSNFISMLSGFSMLTIGFILQIIPVWIIISLMILAITLLLYKVFLADKGDMNQ